MNNEQTITPPSPIPPVAGSQPTSAAPSSLPQPSINPYFQAAQPLPQPMTPVVPVAPASALVNPTVPAGVFVVPVTQKAPVALYVTLGVVILAAIGLLILVIFLT